MLLADKANLCGKRTLRWVKAIVLFLAIAAALGVAGWEIFKDRLAPAPPAPVAVAVPVEAAPVKQQNVPAIVPALGTVESIDTVNITPRVNGRIDAIYFKQGDEVAKGQRLFLINPHPYEAALEQAQGQLAHDEATLAEAKTDLSRYQTLLAENSIARQTAEDQRYVVSQDEGTVKQDEANVANAELNLHYCHINSPIAGRTGALQVDLGNYVQAASAQQSSAASTTGTGTAAGVTPLVTITQMQPIYVSFSVPQTQLETIRENQAKGALTVDAYSQAGQLLATGKLSLINNEVNTATGTITLEATFPNRREILWPNQMVSVNLIEFIRKDVLTVPSQAVMTGPTGPYVYVIGPADKVRRVNVTVTATQDNLAVIGKGLQAGERVVTAGQYRLADGVTVTVEAPKTVAPG
jgi:membrane fusion protein, multidrug efflux system